MPRIKPLGQTVGSKGLANALAASWGFRQRSRLTSLRVMPGDAAKLRQRFSTNHRAARVAVEAQAYCLRLQGSAGSARSSSSRSHAGGIRDVTDSDISSEIQDRELIQTGKQ
ncbi:MAG: hypothetical protein EBV68_12615 [Betaproteobacteria bacterium]|nr:hypothetical protein [Betaproteobacteria bacterium]